MWYEQKLRRHLCDMHIDDWSDEFLSRFSPEEYLENLKTAKVNNAMLYFQSHVGLCYYPTKSGKMHNAFRGCEDKMKRLAEMCHQNGIAVTGYYSLIYNNWAYHTHPEWRMVSQKGEADFGERNFKASDVSKLLNRYGFCCPNNKEYRQFVSEQIREICDYFTFDAMFFDMLFWPRLCECPSCKARFLKETGHELPKKEDWNDPVWLLQIWKRREWMGEFAQSVTDELKTYAPHASVEHNCASAALPEITLGQGEEVLNACDYAGGDLYGGIYHQSFTCKFYRNITTHQPFEYMLSRCEPTLAKHTITRSFDAMTSSVLLTSAHHGATLVIDAIDPCGTLDHRFYERMGNVFAKSMPYEKYFEGTMIEDVGIYYSLRSKFNNCGEDYTNHTSCVNAAITMIKNHICCGITGGYHDIFQYPLLIAPNLTAEDDYDNERLIQYVENGGCLYISGGNCQTLLKTFFQAEITGRTRERVVYIAPKPENVHAEAFGWFNEAYPLHFDATAPIAEHIDENAVIATLTLPYTPQDIVTFASIHSNPPGIRTKIPAVAFTSYGKGKVLWSALPIESMDTPYQYSEVFLNLLQHTFGISQTVCSDAPEDVELVAFKNDTEMTVSAVQLCTGQHARRVEPFTVHVRSEKAPQTVLQLPEETACDFHYENGMITYSIPQLAMIDMKKIIF